MTRPWFRVPGWWLAGLTALTTVAASAAPAPARDTLTNGRVTAEFADGRCIRLHDARAGRALEFADETCAIVVGEERLAVPGLKAAGVKKQRERLVYTYDAGQGRTLDVIYELKRDWHFVSKQLRLTLPQDAVVRLEAVELLRAKVGTAVAENIPIGGGSKGAFLRLGREGATAPAAGAFLVIQNPFMKYEFKDGALAMGYVTAMEWKGAYGAFESDRACLGLHPLTGHRLPMRSLPEWRYEPDPAAALAGQVQLDTAETDAMTRCVAAFLLINPKQSDRIHIPWCENDYQIDVGKPEGRVEYKRIMDQAAAVGCRHLLLTPENSAVSLRKENTDAWAWENVLFLGLGPKVRTGEWVPGRDPIPPTIRELLDYAKGRRLGIMAYVYPTLGFKQNPEWTAWCKGETGGYRGVDTGIRSFQDWFVDLLVKFQKATGITGYCFDHWWIAYTEKEATSQYAQWYGCRRILEELRRRLPDIVIDGRQQYHWFGPWTWLAGSYPHPMMSDEQPGSYENFPDLHFDRVSAARQRFAAWMFRNEQFTPNEILPGFMTHQSERNNAKGQNVRDEYFHVRDWDLLGWRYSVIASIGTAPFWHVVNYIPSRDPDEFRLFPAGDQRWFRKWFDWTDRNMATLRKMRTIIGPPTLGRIDGTAAIDGDRGFIFLFNPNYRLMTAEFTLDESIGVTKGDRFVLRELYPVEGRLHAAPGGTWAKGEPVRMPIKGPEARVLELVPADELDLPAVLNVTGSVKVSRGGEVEITGARHLHGHRRDIVVLLARDTPVTRVRVNGVAIGNFEQKGRVLAVPVMFGGLSFSHCPQVGRYDPAFAGPVFRGSFTVPARVFAQLEARRKAWPVPYTEEDLVAPWLGSYRLLLFALIADPKDTWNVEMTIDGQPVEMKKAYGSVFPTSRERTFLGFYADVSSLKPDVPHQVEVRLPEGLRPGQFQGLFFENVEAELTDEVSGTK